MVITNPNLLLANRLGLVNPLSVAWELVPFSFVVDWFSGVGNVLDGYTDLLGLSVVDTYSVRYLRGRVTGSYYERFNPGNRCECLWRAGYVRRSTSLSKPVATYPKLSNFGHSITRAATAVSLLTAVFLDK